MTAKNNMKKELVKQEKPYWTEDQKELIKSTIAKGATDDELKLFLYVAQKTKLDPLTKQIHFVKRSGQITIQTAIDGYRAIAERSGALAGIEDAVFDDETQPKPKKATVTVYKMVEGQRVGFTASARWSEYAPTGAQAFMWNKMPYLMLAKCAEALALRKAFPNDLSGIYTNEEMSQASNDIEVTHHNSVTNGDVMPGDEMTFRKTLKKRLEEYGMPIKDMEDKMQKSFHSFTEEECKKLLEKVSQKIINGEKYSHEIEKQ